MHQLAIHIIVYQDFSLMPHPKQEVNEMTILQILHLPGTNSAIIIVTTLLFHLNIQERYFGTLIIQ